jgi:hypothetical protein
MYRLRITNNSVGTEPNRNYIWEFENKNIEYHWYNSFICTLCTCLWPVRAELLMCKGRRRNVATKDIESAANCISYLYRRGLQETKSRWINARYSNTGFVISTINGGKILFVIQHARQTIRHCISPA